MAEIDVEFFFDPVCPFCWVTSHWVRSVQRQRGLGVDWRFISLAMLNDAPGAYDGKPAHYPQAHQRGLQMLRVAAAARHAHGREGVGALYQAMGEAVWEATPPVEAEFDALARLGASLRNTTPRRIRRPSAVTCPPTSRRLGRLRKGGSTAVMGLIMPRRGHAGAQTPRRSRRGVGALLAGGRRPVGQRLGVEAKPTAVAGAHADHEHPGLRLGAHPVGLEA